MHPALENAKSKNTCVELKYLVQYWLFHLYCSLPPLQLDKRHGGEQELP